MIETRKHPEGITRNEKIKAAEIARLIARLPEREQAKIYYMLKGSEIFNGSAIQAMPRTVAV
ncbi:MAG: hypothetical protein FWC70_05515 [Defluviitaleaceae bacterium]|nr:hypothetical protein [Defluviitaleaceae bacterium]